MDDKKEGIEEKKQSLNAYARFSGLILQMAAMVLLGAWGGQKLDKFLLNKFPLFTVLLILLMAFGALWLLFRTILKK
ncbi:MAG: AtpZ/AtpI family protein [Bacteroidales bacterium]